MVKSWFENDNVLFYIILGATVTLGIVLNVMFARMVKRLFNKTRIGQDEIRLIIKKIKWPVICIILSLAAMVAITSYQGTVYYEYALYKTFNLTLIFGIAWALVSMVIVLKAIMLSKYDLTAKDNLGARKVFTQYDILERIVIAVIVIVTVSVALMSFQSIREIGVSLFASAGIIGIIIGLAAQKLIGVFLAGIQLAITQPIRIDDVVIVEGEWGWIEDINLTFVVIKIWDKRRLVVPTTYFIEKPFQNWTRVSADILGTVFIYTDYTFPVEALRQEVGRLLKETDLWDGQTNVLQVTDTNDKTMELRVLVSAPDSPTAWDLRVWLREKLITFIQQEYPDSLPKTRVVLGRDGEFKTPKDWSE